MRITTCEMHTCGEPLRIVETGLPDINGNTIVDKVAFIRENCDDIRKFLMHEPRGHHDMFGTLRVEPDLPSADAAFVFMNNEGYTTMCGHAIIALGRYCVDNGIVEAEEPETLVNIQCPCGLIPTYVSSNKERSGRVRFHSVPSFVLQMDVSVRVPKIGVITVDISYGGAFYAFVSTDALGLTSKAVDALRAVEVGQAVTNAIKKLIKIEHPENEDLGFLAGTIIVDRTGLDTKNLLRQMAVFADHELDRSPCGSGTAAHIALLHAKGLLGVNCEKTFQSIVNDSKFVGRVIRKATCGLFDAVIAEVGGNAYYTGRSLFTSEDEDPLMTGFTSRPRMTAHTIET
uniref:trans-L-3-hydroxyproline dehydratase-like isoform X1 n=1 Tax=Styela clava TaxID=7725 RepID=UPI00193A2AE6|nr:trans-L-3-hydroxyproline dehydratase-like isoform X1 [Styela clava]